MFLLELMATNFSPSKGSYVLNQFPSISMFGMKAIYISASGAIQGHHGPLVFLHSSSPTDVHYFNNSYVGKQPVAWKEYCAKYWLKELQESMDRCTGRHDITEILLKTAFNTIQSTNQQFFVITWLSYVFVHVCYLHFTLLFLFNCTLNDQGC